MEDLRRFRAECCLEYVVAQFRDKRSWRPGPEDWVRLYWAIDLVHADFTKRLQERVYLTDKELKIACLTKVKVQPTVIAWLFSCSLTDISMTRKRLYERITGERGSAPMFDLWMWKF
jgi:hypothetical protein